MNLFSFRPCVRERDELNLVASGDRLLHDINGPVSGTSINDQPPDLVGGIEAALKV
jgi:hypothetical protein